MNVAQRQNRAVAWPKDNRLVELLGKRGDQAALARHLKIDTSAISHWKKGNGSPDPEMLSRACDFWGVSADYVLGRSDIEVPDPEAASAERLATDLSRSIEQAVSSEIKRFRQRLRDGEVVFSDPLTQKGGVLLDRPESEDDEADQTPGQEGAAQ